ncbi:hypothetical protein ASE01_16210 [Nocardioides sp. Root190]|uniref:DUF6174 domain-containing protein n=1 Tax=Nocardioides sp. Root190 TaxID=1736488 RepID=UPI0006F9F761|nr:DUF6174 domain-containing protein [Nocardioides sp. Root190]KRB74925.1 hypothetical protein ASE01_16210 [Nocardioides sp. Root190]
MRLVHTPSFLPVAAVLTTALLVSGCSREDDGEARDTTPSASPPTSQAPSDGAGTAARSYPVFAPQNYTYRLEVLCFCPLVGPLAITVADGVVTTATSIGGETRGEEAPEYARLTINDVIARANDARVAAVEVVWPAGQDHPDRVVIDQIEMATDDEVTYTIRDVQVR